MKVKIVTLNAGLLSVMGGFQFAPFVEERLVALPSQLLRLDADLVALQEVYKWRHQEFILSKVREVYPFSARSRTRRNLGIYNGLMVLSKTPVTGSLELFRDAPVDERLFDNKGLLVSRTTTGEGGCLALVDLHTTAGGFTLHPEASKANQIRARQIRQALLRAKGETGLTLIVGDVNAGPGVSEENFRQILDAGYESIYDLLHSNGSECTWDPENRLNRRGPHRTSPPQRIDHVFVSKNDLQAGRVRPIGASICCTEEVVPTPDGGAVTVSDHFGLQVDLELAGSCDA